MADMIDQNAFGPHDNQALAPEAGGGRVVTYQAPRFSITPVLIGINVLVFLAMIAKGVPLVSPNLSQAVHWGADFGPATIGLRQVWRLLTSNYIHFGIVHLLLNMWCLWGLGKLTESFYSTTDYILLYTLTGVAGSILSVALKPLVVSGGASGAIFGLAGVMLTTLKWGNLPLPPENRKALYRGVLQFAGINLLFGAYARGIDNLGHIGGLLYGLLIGAVLGKHLDDSPDSQDYRRKAWLWMVFAIAVLIFLLTQLHYTITLAPRK